MANDIYYTKSFSVHKIKEKELYEFLSRKSEEGNVAIYIRDLIKKDMQGLSPSSSSVSQIDIENRINNLIEKKVNDLVAIKVEDVLSRLTKNNTIDVIDKSVLDNTDDYISTDIENNSDDALGISSVEIDTFSGIDLGEYLGDN